MEAGMIKMRLPLSYHEAHTLVLRLTGDEDLSPEKAPKLLIRLFLRIASTKACAASGKLDDWHVGNHIELTEIGISRESSTNSTKRFKRIIIFVVVIGETHGRKARIHGQCQLALEATKQLEVAVENPGGPVDEANWLLRLRSISKSSSFSESDGISPPPPPPPSPDFAITSSELDSGTIQARLKSSRSSPMPSSSSSSSSSLRHSAEVGFEVETDAHTEQLLIQKLSSIRHVHHHHIVRRLAQPAIRSSDPSSTARHPLDHAVSLHLSELDSAEPLPVCNWLAREWVNWSGVPELDLVLRHVDESLTLSFPDLEKPALRPQTNIYNP
ncbi:hypothetical protein HID58_020503 [Brassica napus]|uniref:Uncharacterized protein n=1 Tax=Brassica napus TaxID=3708 RepID=A0ABQ7XGT1_BRANA|nr:hypothetical protein HID58_020503 [Brassica napus]